MQSNKIIRAGFAGSGFSASFQIEGLKRVYGTNPDIVGVWSPTPAKRNEFAKKNDIRAYESLEQLAGDVDVVHVCVMASAHEEVAIKVLEMDKHVILEKPFTGYFGDGTASFNGDTCDKETARLEAMESVRRLLEAEQKSMGKIFYAENWVYAPTIQKEVEIIEKTGAQILWIHGEEAHSGSHSKSYAEWKHSGGGVMIGKGCHPLTAALYLKRVEGFTRDGRPIRPKSITARVHALTRLKNYRDEGHLRNNYHDIDDFSMMHITFEDGTIADIFASDIINGGIHNYLEVNANNHRTICNINPNNAMQTYNPVEENFKDIYVVEKTGTKQGWSSISPDEDWFTGYPQELEAFYNSIAYGKPVASDSLLAADTISTIYSGYVSTEQKGVEILIPEIKINLPASSVILSDK